MPERDREKAWWGLKEFRDGPVVPVVAFLAVLLVGVVLVGNWLGDRQRSVYGDDADPRDLMAHPIFDAEPEGSGTFATETVDGRLDASTASYHETWVFSSLAVDDLAGWYRREFGLRPDGIGPLYEGRLYADDSDPFVGVEVEVFDGEPGDGRGMIRGVPPPGFRDARSFARILVIG